VCHKIQRNATFNDRIALGERHNMFAPQQSVDNASSTNDEAHSGYSTTEFA